MNGEGRAYPDGRFSVPIRCTGTLQLELTATENAHERVLPSVRHSVAVREEVDTDVGTLFLDSPTP